MCVRRKIRGLGEQGRGFDVWGFRGMIDVGPGATLETRDRGDGPRGTFGDIWMVSFFWNERHVSAMRERDIEFPPCWLSNKTYITTSQPLNWAGISVGLRHGGHICAAPQPHMSMSPHLCVYLGRAFLDARERDIYI
jgi:hypothetical protein